MITEEDIEISIKLVIIGNGGVGKSSLIQRYCKGIFTKDYKKTIGVDFLEKVIELDDDQIRLQIWDTAGQEEFDAITKSYYRGAHACILAYSTTDRASFYAIQSWKNKIENECGPIITFLIQNKIDLEGEAQVDWREGEELAKELGVKFYRTSVKDNINVDEVFKQIAETYLSSLVITKADIVYHDKMSDLFNQSQAESNTKRTRYVAQISNGFKLEQGKRRTKQQKKDFLKKFAC